MKTKRMLLVAGGLSAIVLAASGLRAIAQSAPPPIDHRPLVVTGLGGTLHLIQAVPCNQVVEVTTMVRDGRAELTPSEGIPDLRTGGKTFTMVSLTLLYEPFMAVGDCLGFRDSHKVTDLGIKLAGKYFERPTAAAALIAGLPVTAFFGDAHDIHADQGLKVPGGIALGRHDEHMFRLVQIAGLDLLDPGVVGARGTIGFFQ